MSFRHGLMAAFAACAASAALAEQAADPRRSGLAFMSPQTQAMQSDDSLNPGMLWVAEGEQLWQRRSGAHDLACSDCHGTAAERMRGVAARYPAFDNVMRRPISLNQRINACREQRQRATPWPAESAELLGIATYLTHLSRGLPIAPDPDPRLDGFRENGRRLYAQRIGQLDLSCAQCHDAHAGQRLGGSIIPQAHPTGYPLYRLEWQTLGSLHRRLRNCMVGVRAEPYAYDAAELVDLELFLADRARGMPIETPAVRP
jgi:sulfur-oxidizing protein SoxA